MAPNKNQKRFLANKRTQDKNLTTKSSKKNANKEVVAVEDKENIFGLTFRNTD